MFSNRFEYFAPKSLEEALALLATYQDDAKLLAGGQSLLSLMKLRLANPRVLIDLGRIADLDYLRADGDKLNIGALATYAQIKESELLQNKCPLLPKTASVVGDAQVRNRGTLGGSLAHADPHGDMPAAALALEAELKAVGPKGARWIRAEDFFVGIFSTVLAPDEILTEIRVPASDNTRSVYLKAARRPSDFAMVGVALRLKLGPEQTCEQITIGVTGVTDKPYRGAAVEKALRGQKLNAKTIEEAAALITDGVDVAEDLHASKKFRSHLARLYTGRAIRAAM
ncbi:MAG: xanthine dehydrogenase family protein subunit M [Deltaproteobacteria bacterium]|nr:xanthine dehydrogenase family protein subunit M [Deltaproteobacteria bacterium]MDZ4343398.1 xanthine dehydrogenase family protein subunit M [Candidatus Binatia bacterium]